MPATATAPRYRPANKLPPQPDSAPTFAPRLPCPVPEGREQYLSNWCEERRLTLLKDTANHWSARARQATTEASFHYAANRSASLRRRLHVRLRQCGTVLMEVRCDGGRRATIPRPCRQWWVCATCRQRRANGMRRRIVDGLALAWYHATRGKDARDFRIRLTTLTVRHTGDFADDRQRLADAWRAFYRAATRAKGKGGRRWLGRFPYVAVWEVTPGIDGLGHPHLHVAWVGPRFVAYGKLARMWRVAIGDAKARPPNHQTRVGGGEKSVIGCANYLGKYLSKGVELGGFDDELRAQVLASFYNQHLVLTSRKFWGPKECGCCGGRWRAVLPWPGDVLGRDSSVAPASAGPPEDCGPGDARGVPGSQCSLELPDRFGLVLHRW